MRNRKRRIWPGILLILSLVWLGAAGCGNFGDRQADSGQGNTELNGETLEVHFIDVGQGDATLIKQGDHAMLIDAGDNDKGTALQSYLQHQGVEHLDYAVGTHPDSDHIGGLDVVLYKFSWDQVIMPDLEKDTKTYQDVLRVIQDKGTEITYPKAGAVYSLGSAEFTVIAPVKEDYGDNWNDYSVGISLQFGKNRFVFTGDAEEDAEQDMLAQGIDLSADVLKAA
ncbi:MAG: MBL fold metallo-hydrolase, partial [Lachnospiraceae bacterium]|nr:MBL fold metallo-hydrolase [Lachnospiraceae bacterium]